MTKEINLLPQKNRQNGNKNKGLIWFKWISLGSLVLVVVLSMAVFLINYFSPVTVLEKQEASLVTQFASLNNKTAKYLYLKDRLRKIKTIFDSRKSLAKEGNYILTAVPNGVSLGSLSISKNSIDVSATADSLTMLDTFMANLVKLADKKVFSKVTLVDLGVDPVSGHYSLSLKLVLL